MTDWLIDPNANTPQRNRTNWQRLAELQASGDLKGDTGATGATGATGPAGADGADGTAATVAVGTTTTLAAGSSATVTNSGTSAAAVFDFGIPQGAKGDTGATGATGPAIVTTKGDLATFDTDVARQPVGTDGQVLSADSGEATGLKWINRGRVLFAASAASSTISNTSSDTNFDVNTTIPANFFTAGRAIRIQAWGLMSSNTTAATMTLSVKLGTSGLFLFGPFSTAGLNNMDWVIDAIAVCQTTGASGDFQASGTLTSATASGNSAAITLPARFTTSTQDTTSSHTFQLSAHFSVASISESIVMNGLLLEVLG